MAMWQYASIARVRCQSGNPGPHLERTTSVGESPRLPTQMLHLPNPVTALPPERGNLVAKYDGRSVQPSNRYDASSGQSTMAIKSVTHTVRWAKMAFNFRGDHTEAERAKSLVRSN